MIGFLNINKPKGLSSAQVVARVKHLCPKGTKVGHMGTLDPMASGVLPIAIGRATRLFDIMQNKQKEYIATFKFGYTTDTLDITGKITQETKILPTYKQIESTLSCFIGKIKQLPPSFSAKNIDGKRAYDLARKGKEVKLELCEVNIYDFKLIDDLGDNAYRFKIVCGSGTYIRSLCRDLALKLGTLGVMTDLVRTKTGYFDLNNAVGLDELSLTNLIDIDKIIDAQKIELSEQQLRTLLDGKKLVWNKQDGLYLGYLNNELQLLFNIKQGNTTNKVWLR